MQNYNGDILKGKWGDKNQFFLKDSLQTELMVFCGVPTIYH